jgi:hypothetical protein
MADTAMAATATMGENLAGPTGGTLTADIRGTAGPTGGVDIAAAGI